MAMGTYLFLMGLTVVLWVAGVTYDQKWIGSALLMTLGLAVYGLYRGLTGLAQIVLLLQ